MENQNVVFARVKEECDEDYYFVLHSSEQEALKHQEHLLDAIYPVRGLDKKPDTDKDINLQKVLDTLLHMDSLCDGYIRELLECVFAAGYRAGR